MAKTYIFGDSLDDLARDTAPEDTYSQLLTFKQNPGKFLGFLHKLDGEQLFHVSEQFGEEKFDKIYDRLTNEQKKALSHYQSSRIREQSQELADTGKSNTELEQRVESLISELHTDDVTGLLNKRSLDQYVTGRIHDFMDEVAAFLKEKQVPTGSQKHPLITEDTAISKAIKSCKKDFATYQPKGDFTRDVTLAFGDLNGFKPVNDLYGHFAGDKVLSIVATTLHMAARDVEDNFDDTTVKVYRFGGDEFILISEGDGSPSLKEHLKRTIQYELDNPDNYVDIDKGIRNENRVGMSMGYSNTLSFEGLCETLQEYVRSVEEHEENEPIRVKDIVDRRDAIAEGLRKKIDDTLYKKAGRRSYN
jgi:diguanylate cyclase (GGDEF)-like protein